MHDRTKKILSSVLGFTFALAFCVTLILLVLEIHISNYHSGNCDSNIEASTRRILTYTNENDFLPAGNSVKTINPPVNWRAIVFPF